MWSSSSSCCKTPALFICFLSPPFSYWKGNKTFNPSNGSLQITDLKSLRDFKGKTPHNKCDLVNCAPRGSSWGSSFSQLQSSTSLRKKCSRSGVQLPLGCAGRRLLAMGHRVTRCCCQSGQQNLAVPELPSSAQGLWKHQLCLCSTAWAPPPSTQRQLSDPLVTSIKILLFKARGECQKSFDLPPKTPQLFQSQHRVRLH